MFASERLWDMAYLSIEDMDCLPTVEKVQQSQKGYPNDRGAYIDQHEGKELYPWGGYHQHITCQTVRIRSRSGTIFGFLEKATERCVLHNEINGVKERIEVQTINAHAHTDIGNLNFCIALRLRLFARN